MRSLVLCLLLLAPLVGGCVESISTAVDPPPPPPVLANLAWSLDHSFCSSDMTFRVRFENLGSTTAKDTRVGVEVFHAVQGGMVVKGMNSAPGGDVHGESDVVTVQVRLSDRACDLNNWGAAFRATSANGGSAEKDAYPLTPKRG